MLVGEDFDEIQFELFGLELVERNSFVSNTLLFIVALIVAWRIKKLEINNPFFTHWRWFFIIFGTGFFLGGFGHLFFNYTGIPGKFPALYLGIISASFMEKAMASLLKNESIRKLFNKLIIFKLAIALISVTIVFTYVDLESNPADALVVTSVNAVVESIFALVLLGYKYAKSITPAFHYMWIGVLMMIPSRFIQKYKINFHQWFDRNVLCHLLIIFSIIINYQGIKGYAKTISK